jgi:hypothetical protein
MINQQNHRAFTFGNSLFHIYLNFPIINLPFICINIPAVTAHGGYISKLVRYLEIDSDSLLRTKLYDKRDDFNFFIANLISILNLATFQQHLHMEYTSLSWSDIVVPIMISLMLDADKETFESRVPSG